MYDPGNYDAAASQSGVGFASVNAYEFTFFGQTQRGHSVFLLTEPGSPAGFTMLMLGESCFGANGPACAYQDVYVMGFTPAGFTYAGASAGGGAVGVCYVAGPEYGCLGPL